LKRAEKPEWIAILDFGSQYTQLIARRVREAKIYSEIFPYNVEISTLLEHPPKGIILSGGPATIYENQSPLCDEAIFELGIPILGICYGAQLIAHILGGKVAKSNRAEYGRVKVFLDNEEDIFCDFPPSTTCWMSHQDLIEDIPPNFEVIARSENTKAVAIVNRKKKIYGIQFHPEVTHTTLGKKLFKNFLYKICQCHPSWNLESFIQQTVKNVREKVGAEKVIAGVSGGIDSLVAAILTHRAIGDQLYCLFINTGLLRKGEAEEVQEVFKSNFHLNLIYVDAAQRFLEKLRGVDDPERKRKIVGEEFIRVFEEEAKGLGGVKYLLQGTLYPDVIESISLKGPSSTIKSHHNVGGLPEVMKLEVIEPLKYLFKDEVRKIAKKLKLPDEIIWRQPFPGPGLAIRIIGPIEKEKLDILREADEIIKQEICKANLYKRVWQSFGILLPVKSVGVMGDSRTYEFALVLRVVTSEDGMTADWAKIPYKVLGGISSRIINEVKGINRVVFDISSKPPATIEWE